ncbi:MAG: hydantoinase/oxoprolinase family protein [Rhodobacteraceae bacterium]|nr:MAG: hydantoinase/oxoprolinase family protein [Paracoccaceae bacterium]
MYYVGVDVGGTFTDLVLFDAETGAVNIHKVPTTPDNPARGVLAGIDALCARFGAAREAVRGVRHGTTTATNAILEHDGATVGMITNEGYRDIVHIGRHQRPQHFSIRQEIPWQDRALARRRHRKTVPHRIAPPTGEVLTPLDEAAVRRAATELAEAGVEAVAVCFLFSYLAPEHEARAAEIVREALPGAFVTTSASVSPQFREFERFTTTLINGFVGPKVRRYVTDLEERLQGAGHAADLHIMASNGGVATAAMVSEKPILTLLSGPAAGVLGGAWSGALSGRKSLITFDVGGTSADIGIVADGRFGEASPRDTWIAGFPVMAPMIDIHTIGAGGGSIAHRDAGGAFRVGPRSAGARPGPACYGHGGTEPTVTDANLVLGRLDPENFLGGEMALDAAAAERAVARLAQDLGMDLLEAAEGVVTIVNANMANAIRSRTVQRGLDPRDFALMAFGGGGPMHAADVAAMLGVPEVIVPAHPGITSAIGLLTTDLRYDTIRTAFQVEGAVDHAFVDRSLQEMTAGLSELYAKDGVDAGAVRFERAADIRYVGQGYELRVDLPEGRFDAAAEAALFAAFEERHRREYGHVFRDSPKEIVNLRLVGVGAVERIAAPALLSGGSRAEALVRTGDCAFRVDREMRAFPTAFYRRDRLPIGERIEGPAVILQQDSTTLVRPGDSFVADGAGNLLIRVVAP